MKVTVEKDVFEDPEFCYSSSGKCDHLAVMSLIDLSRAACNCFKDGYDKPLRLKYDKQYFDILKCDECKTAYQKALKEKETEDTVEEIELLEKCADILEKMEEVCWNEDSIWNDNSYGKVAKEVYNFLNDQKNNLFAINAENQENS